MINRTHSTLFQTSAATFSDCKQYRYLLSRVWDKSLPSVCYLMMNPSTATEVDNDATIERCQRRATLLGYGSIVIVNMFPYRETHSFKLKDVSNLIGDQVAADDAIADAVSDCAITICGWGEHNEVIGPRAKAVYEILSERGLAHKLHALNINRDGSPQHPLYVAYAKQPISWEYKENK